MKLFDSYLPKTSTLVRTGLLLVALALSGVVAAQGVLQNSQTGTVQLLRQDDGYIAIPGRNIPYVSDITRVFLNNEEIGSGFLDEGMVVRYTLNQEGVLLRVEILGPIDKIRELSNH